MRILALDTATRATVVALCDVGSGTLELQRRDDPEPGARPRHTQTLLVLALELLEQSDTDWPAIDRLAVGIGPGTFTGLRIGVASARALAAARSIPLVGVSTLESLARGAARAGDAVEVVCAVLDARRREVFAAAWERTPDAGLGRRVLEPVALAPDRLGETLAGLGRSALAIGDGALEFRAALERSGATIPGDGSGLHQVSAIDHCWLAAGMEAGPPDEVRPAYLRLPDAEIARQATDRS